MRVRLPSPFPAFAAAAIMAVVFHAPAPAGTGLVGAPPGEMGIPAVDHVSAMEERLTSLRVAASRHRARAATRVWPAAGLHTGWWGEVRGGRLHGGIDIDGDTGDGVVAAARGSVAHAGPAPAGYGGYGLMVIIEHGDFATLYAHLSRIDVTAGQVLEAGAAVGAMGTTGSVTGSHLHFETRVAGVPVDPAQFMATATRSRQSARKDPPVRQYWPFSRSI